MKKITKALNWISFALIFAPNFALAAQNPCPDKDVNGVTLTGFHSVFGPDCLYTYTDWIQAVWSWAMVIIIPLSVLILSAAGVIYMISEGDSTRVGLAKKMIMGVLSGVGLLVLSRLLINIILGDAGVTQWWQF